MIVLRFWACRKTSKASSNRAAFAFRNGEIEPGIKMFESISKISFENLCMLLDVPSAEFGKT